ncbi:MAG: flagellar motor switch protein FliN [Bryobacteraceae bacterium]|jgi:flagellar motor switch protein FliN
MTQQRDFIEKSFMAPSAQVSDPQASFSKTAGLLMDLKLQVKVLFGRTNLRLKDLLKLGSGSIVELDRAPDDVVELVINDRVIARGQVVVIEGCYGIRITEILKPSDSADGPVGDLVNLLQGVR